MFQKQTIKDKNQPRYQAERDQKAKTTSQSFQKKFKLTQKIQNLISPIYERSLSPWTRKRNESIDRKQYAPEQANLNSDEMKQMTASTLRQSPTHLTSENKLHDFLRKIQFSKRKKGKTLSNFTLDNIGDQQAYYEKLQANRLPNKNIAQFGSDQTRTFVFYPKLSTSVKLSEIQQYIKDHKRDNSKQSVQNKIATIRNFYDPYQNSPKTALKTQYSKGGKGFAFKVNNKIENENNVDNFEDQYEPSFRKNSMQQKSYRQMLNSTKKNTSQKTFMLQNSTQKSFFIANMKNISRKMLTEPSYKNTQTCQNPQIHQRNNSNNEKTKVTQPSYSTSSPGQAIKRIKQQYKRSRRINTQVKKQRNSIESCYDSNNKGEKEFLYKTFLNYKNDKHTSDNNITKTLRFTFHNKKSFQNKIEEILNAKAH